MFVLADATGIMACTLSVAVPLIILYLVWQFFRGAVQSGVSKAIPHAPPVDEGRIREIVRDEVRKIVAERKSRAGS